MSRYSNRTVRCTGSGIWDPTAAPKCNCHQPPQFRGPDLAAKWASGRTQEIRTVHPPSDFESFRQSVADAVERGDATSVLSVIHPTARTVAVEHGSAFRELVSGLPTEIWHNDARIAEAMGGSFRAPGSPRGKSALGYFRAAEDAIATTPNVPAHCLVSVLVGHAGAFRTLGLLAQSRAKLIEVDT